MSTKLQNKISNGITGIRDLDLKILQGLEDTDFQRVCLVSQYINSLCEDENFWLTRFLNLGIFNMNYLRKLKGNFKWKDLYQYYREGFGRRKEGILESVKRDNVYLYKLLFRYMDKATFEESLKLAAENESTNVITYTLFNYNREEFTNFTEGVNVKLLLSLNATEKVAEWLYLMNQLEFGGHIIKLIERIENPINDIKEFLPQIENDDLEGIMYVLGESLNKFSLESRVQVLKYLLKEQRAFYNHLTTAIEGAANTTDRNKLRRWRIYIEKLLYTGDDNL